MTYNGLVPFTFPIIFHKDAPTNMSLICSTIVNQSNGKKLKLFLAWMQLCNDSWGLEETLSILKNRILWSVSLENARNIVKPKT